MSGKVDKNSFGKLTRLKELRIKHQKINAEIDQISSNPETDQLSLRRLKTRRLLLKDMIANSSKRYYSLLIYGYKGVTLAGGECAPLGACQRCACQAERRRYHMDIR